MSACDDIKRTTPPRRSRVQKKGQTFTASQVSRPTIILLLCGQTKSHPIISHMCRRATKLTEGYHAPWLLPSKAAERNASAWSRWMQLSQKEKKNKITLENRSFAFEGLTDTLTNFTVVSSRNNDSLFRVFILERKRAKTRRVL